MTGPEDRPAVLSALMTAYAELSAAWSAAWTDRMRDPSGRWVRWRDAERRGIPWATLIQAGEMTSGTCAQAVRAHLDLLCRAYWPDIIDPADDPVSHPAAYPPARAVLEATAEMIWVLDPAIDDDERAMRSAELMLWSQGARRRPDKGWHDTAREAGLTVAEIGKPGSKWHQHVHVRPGETEKKALTISRMIEAAHGQDGLGLYDEWSPVSHTDPFTMLDRATFRDGDGGYYVGGEFREDDDVRVALAVAELVTSATTCMVGYWGRNPDPIGRCKSVVEQLREFLPVVEHAMAERRERGRASG